ncbi:MAG: potassium channel family protein [Methylococcales bacterium]|nr:potassium channel family protein [Methylococcales bacterium]
MFLIKHLKRLLLRNFMELRAQTIALAVLAYIGACYALLFYSGERALMQIPDFFYWLVVTASTVGYGDFAPETDAGKLSVILFVIPVGISLFALIIGRAAVLMNRFWKKGVLGMHPLNLSDHILVLGWNDARTLRLLRLLIREQQGEAVIKPVALCVTELLENPLPGEIEFVKAEDYQHDPDLNRACIDSAAIIIIDMPEDDKTLAAALYCHSRNPNAHLIAYFHDQNLSRLLKHHCPTAECMPSLDLELLAKSALNPGSSVLHQDLLNVETGMSQYAIRYPENAPQRTVNDLFLTLKTEFDAILIAITAEPGQVSLNPPLHQLITCGAIIYYIADERIDGKTWEAFCVRS